MKWYAVYFLLYGLCSVNGRSAKRGNHLTENQLLEEELVSYVGAVLEYEPFSTWDEEGRGFKVVETNAGIISDYAKKAKEQNADILITPEYGLQSLNDYSDDFDKFKTFGQYVPDPLERINPCDLETENENFQGVKMLSCAAKNNSIYLVVDMEELYPCSDTTVSEAPWTVEPSGDCPSEGFFVYNTQAVFDREGLVIARYRKQNLYHEYQMTPGPEDDSTALFHTDFDVLFTLQICFDIVFEHPGFNNVQTIGLKDVAMSTAWVDYLPFNLADNVQNAWSKGLGVNLLVAGYHYPEKMKLGSGIYRNFKGEAANYTYDKDSGNKLIVAEVTTIPASNFIAGPYLEENGKQMSSPKSLMNSVPKTEASNEKEDRIHVMVHEDLTKYANVTLTSGEEGEQMSETICSYDDFCCEITYEYSGDLTYMFLVFSGQFQVSDGEYPIGIQNCAVVWCPYKNVSSCARPNLGEFSDDSFGPFTLHSDSFSIDTVYPGGNKRDLLLLGNDAFEFTGGNKDYTFTTLEPVDNLLQASLYGRWYENDGFN